MADVTFFGFGATAGYASPDTQLTSQTPVGAEYSLGGLVPTGFGDPDVEIVSNNISAAQVSFEAAASGAGVGKLSTEVTFYSPSLYASTVEGASVELYNEPPPRPWSPRPNVNEVVYRPLIFGGSPLTRFSAFFLAAGGTGGNVVQPGLDNINGANGLVGKYILFLDYAGGQEENETKSALSGFTCTITSHTDTLIFITPNLPANPTTTDQFVILDIDKNLRRTPTYEIILE